MTVRHDVSQMREVEEALRRSEAKYREIFENIQDIFFQTDDQGLIVEVSPSVQRYGYTREELIGRPAAELYEEPKQRIRLTQLLENGELTDSEVRLKARDGCVIDFSVSSHVLWNADGAPAGMEGCLRDISDRKLAEEELRMHRDRLGELVDERTAELTQANERLLREAEERMRAEAMTRAQRDLAMALSATSDLQDALRSCLQAAVSVSGMDCGGVYLIDRASGALLLAYHEGLSADFVKSVSHYAPDSANARLVRAGKPAYAVHQELGVPLDQNELAEGLRAIAVLPVHHDGQVIACLNVASHLLDEVPAASRDALEAIAAQVGSSIARVRALEALRESEERFSKAFHTAPVAIAINSVRDRQFIDVNQSFLELVGYSREEVIGRTSGELDLWVDPNDRALLLQTLLQERAIRDFESRVRRKSGDIRDTLTSFSMIEIHGEPCVLGMSRDITEHRQAEEALRESEEKYRQLVENLQEGIWALDKDGHTTFANARMAEMLGYTVDEMLGKHLLSFMDEQWQEVAKEKLERRRQGVTEQHDFEFLRKDGTRVYTSLATNPATDRNGNYIGALAGVMDITDRQQAEEALRESERRFRQVLDVSSDMIYKLDLESDTFDYISPSALEMTGFTPEESIAMGPRGLRRRIHPEDWPDFKRGSEEFVELGSHPGFEYRSQCKDGEYRWLSDNRALVRGEDGRPLALVGTVRDISERKRGEEALQKSVRLLRDTGEMAKVGGWELDLSTKEVSWTEEIGRIHGVEPGYKPKLEEALNFYAPESRPAVEAAVKKAAETGEPYDLESLFIPLGSKDEIWVRSLGKAVYSGGKIVKLAGTFQNIDKYKRADEALRKSEERHRILFETIAQGIV